MISMNILLEGDGPCPDLADRMDKVIPVTTPMDVSALAHGLESGKPSIAFRIDLSDGKVVIAETGLRLFLAAADALKAKYGDPRLNGKGGF